MLAEQKRKRKPYLKLPIIKRQHRGETMMAVNAIPGNERRYNVMMMMMLKKYIS